MCEINPKHTMILRLEFFTSINMTQEKFEEIVCNVVLEMEAMANEDSRIRCHIHENG